MPAKRMSSPFLQGPIISLISFNYFFYAIVSIFISYLPVYFSYKGISPIQIGILLGVGPFIAILSPPLWGYLSDKYKTIKMILLIILLAAVVTGTLLFQSATFKWMLMLVIIFNFFMSPIGPLTDGLTFRVTEHYRISFGSVRLFGSVGFATTALLIGFVFEGLGLSFISWIFLGYGIIAILGCLRLSDAPASAKPVSLRSLSALFKNGKILWFLLIILILSIPHRINDGFMGVYIESLGGSTSSVGTAWFFATASEALVFGLSMRWLRSGNELRLIALAALFYCIRWILCALLAVPEWVSYIQLLHGLTFAVYYLAALQYLYKLIPDELRATGQTVFAAIFFGVAGIVGSLIAGWIFEAFSGRVLYTSMTWFSFLGMLLVLATMYYENKKNEQCRT